MSSSDDVESYRKRLWSLFTQMPNWPYRPVSLRPNGEQCKCGAHRASVVDGKATVTGCSRIRGEIRPSLDLHRIINL
jgi:hypothetical protein